MANTSPADSQPLRIAQVASHHKVARGGAVQMVRLAAALRRRGHSVVCIVHRPSGHPRPAEVDFSEIADAGLPLVGFDMDRWTAAASFRSWLRENPCDVIHAHRDRALGFSHLATLGMRSPVLFAGRGTTGKIKGWRLSSWAFRSRRLSGVIAVAHAVKGALVADRVPAEKVHVVYGSVEMERFHPGVDGLAVRREIGVDDSTPVICLPAALVPKKGHEDFLAMAGHLLETFPESHFLWVGEGKRERFESITAGFAAMDRLHWLGHRDDMPEVLAAASVVVCASTHGEGLTGALREALAMAKPVVTTDVSGNAEMVRDGETGRVVPISDAQAMAIAVGELLRDPERARSLGEAGRAWVLRECSDEVRAERIEKLYREAVRQVKAR